jgi:hypothetical protein
MKLAYEFGSTVVVGAVCNGVVVVGGTVVAGI